MTNQFIPAHVKQWVCEMQEEAYKQRVSTKKTALASTPLDSHRRSYNDIEAEVIEGGRRCASVETSGEDDGGQPFGRHLFESKKAHRVACLLASARLITGFSSQAVGGTS
eukprot:3595921-Rhodomonas_salina.1